MISTTKERRPAIRAALDIHGNLAGTHVAIDELPQAAWEELRLNVSQLQRAIARGWRVAGQHLLEDLDYRLQRMARELDSYRQELPPPFKSPVSFTPSEILADLGALEDEFDDVSLDLQVRTISVRTGPIELEDIHLGSFRIELRWDQIGQQRPYSVIATDPNPPDGDDTTTHPHVRDDVLCEGEGTASIRAALAQGRLLDFFTLVRQILETYNADSAYVPLNRWNGVGCRDCGWRMPADEHGSCERCDAALCGDCSSSCGGCDRSVCSGCSHLCAACDGNFCSSCLSRQAGSGQLVCESCLNDEENQCDDSEESLPADDPAAGLGTGEMGPADQHLAPDTLCVCEASLPA